MNVVDGLELFRPDGATRFRASVLGDGWTLLFDGTRTYCTTDGGETWSSFDVPAGAVRRAFACPSGAVAVTSDAIWTWAVGGTSWSRHDRWRKEEAGRAFDDELSPVPVACGDLVVDWMDQSALGKGPACTLDVYLLTADGLKLEIHEAEVFGQSVLGVGRGPAGNMVLISDAVARRLDTPDGLQGLPTSTSLVFERNGQIRILDTATLKVTWTGLGRVSDAWLGPLEAFEAGDRSLVRASLDRLQAVRRLGRPGRLLRVFGPLRPARWADRIATSAGIFRVPDSPEGFSGARDVSPWVPAPSAGELAWRLWACREEEAPAAFDSLLDGRDAEFLAEACSLFLEDPVEKLFEFASRERSRRVSRSCSEGVRILCLHVGVDEVALANRHANDPVAAARAVAFAALPSRGVNRTTDAWRWGVGIPVAEETAPSPEELRAVRAATEALADPDASVRAAAAGACGRQEAAAAVHQLVALLPDPDDEVARETLRALSSLHVPLPCDVAAHVWTAFSGGRAGGNEVFLLNLLRRVDDPIADETLLLLLGGPSRRIGAVAETVFGQRARRIRRDEALRFFDASTLALCAFLARPDRPQAVPRGKAFSVASSELVGENVIRKTWRPEDEESPEKRAEPLSDALGIVTLLADALSCHAILETKGLGRAAKRERLDEVGVEQLVDLVRNFPKGEAAAKWDAPGLLRCVDEADAREKLLDVAEALEPVAPELASRLRVRAGLLLPAGSSSNEVEAIRAEATLSLDTPGLPGLVASFILLAGGSVDVRPAIEKRLCSDAYREWPAAFPLYLATLEASAAAELLARFFASPEVGRDDRFLLAQELEYLWLKQPSPAREAGLALMRSFAEDGTARAEQRVDAACRIAAAGDAEPLRRLDLELGGASLPDETRRRLDVALAETGDPAAIDRLRLRLADPFAARSLLGAFAAAGSLDDIDLLEYAADRDGAWREEIESAIAAIRARHGT